MKVVFVCTGNTCRSPMAEYLMKDYCKKKNLKIYAESRGLACSNGKPISENSLIALSNVGIDAKEHVSSSFTLKDLFDADLVVTMTQSHKDALIYHFNAGENVKTFGEITGLGNVVDPYGLSIYEYEKCREQIEKGIPIIVDYLTKK